MKSFLNIDLRKVDNINEKAEMHLSQNLNISAFISRRKTILWTNGIFNQPCMAPVLPVLAAHTVVTYIRSRNIATLDMT